MRKYFVTAAVLGAGFALGVLFVGVPTAVRAGVGGPLAGSERCHEGQLLRKAVLLVHPLRDPLR